MGLLKLKIWFKVLNLIWLTLINVYKLLGACQLKTTIFETYEDISSANYSSITTFNNFLVHWKLKYKIFNTLRKFQCKISKNTYSMIRFCGKCSCKLVVSPLPQCPRAAKARAGSGYSALRTKKLYGVGSEVILWCVKFP